MMGPPGPEGPPGAGIAAVYHAYGSSMRAGVTSSAPVVQPGLVLTFTLLQPSTVQIVATVGISVPADPSGYAMVDAVIYVDGNFLPNGGWSRATLRSGSGGTIALIPINTVVTLPAGAHTIDLRTLRHLSSTVPVDIGGNSMTEVNPGELTLVIFDSPGGGDVLTPTQARRPRQ